MKQNRKIFMFLFLVVLIGFSLFVGTISFTMKDLLAQSDIQEIFFFTRIPRTLSIILTGAGLSLSGLILQQILNNKFASPTTITTSDAARLGILVILLFFPAIPIWIKLAIVFTFSLGGSFLFISLINKIRFKNVILVPLIGITMGMVIQAIVDFIAMEFQLSQALISRMQGSFSLITQGQYELLFIIFPTVIVTYIYAHYFTITGMGESFAKNFGINYKAIMLLGLILVSFMTAAIVVTIGEIGFIGLVIPNIVSYLYGGNMKHNIFETVIFGSIFLLAADILGRVLIFPYEIPVSFIVGVLGAVMFLYILLKKEGRHV